MRRRGITMIELLVVLAIIGVAVGLLLPAVVGGRAAAARTQCQNNQKQIALAMLIYHDEFGTFPAGFSTFRDPSGRAADARWGWLPPMLRMMEQSRLATETHYDLPPAAPENETARVTRINTMLCASDKGAGRIASPLGALGVGPVTSGAGDVGDDRTTVLIANPASGPRPIEVARVTYVASFGTGDPLDPVQVGRGDGVFFRDSAIGLVHIEDGTSTTFLLGERSRETGPATWVGPIGESGAALVLGSTGRDRGPNAVPRSPFQFSSRHEGGAYFAFVDGGVRFVRSEIGPAIFRALATRAGGEISVGEWE